MNKKVLLVSVAATAATALASAPVAHAKGAVVAPPVAQVGTDLAVVLGPTTASPGSSGLFQYTNLPGNVSLRVEVKGATLSGVPVSGPAQIQLSTKSLDCASTTTAVIDGLTFDTRGQAKFQPSTPPLLTGLGKSRTTVNVVSSGGTTVAQFIPEPCIPGIP